MTHDARAAEAVRIGITNRMIMGGCSPEAAANALDLLRDQVLTEAAELIEAESAKGLHIRYGSATDYAEHYADVLLAARTNQEN